MTTQHDAAALRSKAQELVLQAEALEAKLANPEPRPYYYGQLIKARGLRAHALCETQFLDAEMRVQFMVTPASNSSDNKDYCTHLDGTPLGEFRGGRELTDLQNARLLAWREGL